ncbi:CYFA0S17e02234g1_1 [Cyberlindnera fabianii]|uniref:CYFA0S17e02234g1_1 n=1 Tax=Cyberlindnera fabianii TaxID=36022 RepID=A0A061B5W0_CYBFA|nr:CYFA0S17e02234g1_1 [Cyberlindnera fabianii]
MLIDNSHASIDIASPIFEHTDKLKHSTMELDPWAAINSASSALASVSDPKKIQLDAAKKALTLLQSDDSGVLIELCLAAANGDTAQLTSILTKPENIKVLTEQDNSGLSPLIYAVVSGQEDSTELILSKSAASLNEPDGLFGYTPLMWAVYFDNKNIVVELLNHGAKLDVAGKNGLTVFDLVKPASDMHDFFEQHGLFEQDKTVDVGMDFYKDDAHVMGESKGDEELLDNIRLRTAGLDIGNEDGGLYQDSNAFVQSSTLLGDEFNFNKLLKNQYIIFSDYDIPSILDLIFSLNIQHNHKTTYPAAVIYQCVRYADHMKNNDVLVENFLNLAFTKIRSGTASKSGVTSVYSEGDIVLQSYWLSVVNFLFFYLSKDDGFFKRYPKVLQDLINTLNSLMIELANSIKFRLDGLVDSCLLDYASIPDISTTLYRNDWNFFKKKHHSKSTYDEIFDMLYPPTVKEQLKPSPIKIVQTLGALLYVLDLHNIHPVVTQQTLSSVFHWISSTIFNRVISQKRYLSRVSAIQIRLNISVLEDWSRSNNRAPKMPDIDEYLLKLFPYTLLDDNLSEDHNHNALSNVALFANKKGDPHDAAFYHSTLFTIVKSHFEPTFELLQWLQCLSGIQDEENLLSLTGSLYKLNSAQLWKAADKYRYEVDEAKLSKAMRKVIEKRAKESNKPVEGLFYTSKDCVLLNQDYNFPVVLPTIPEMVDEYGAGIGGINKERAREFDPFLPYQIVDAIEEIHDQKTTQKEHDDNNDVQRINDEFEQNIMDVGTTNAHDTGLFSEMTMPASLAHRPWGEDENEINPW